MHFDQGEIISPLLWVIYIDPLLTALSEHNLTPYTIESTTPTTSENYPNRFAKGCLSLLYYNFIYVALGIFFFA